MPRRTGGEKPALERPTRRRWDGRLRASFSSTVRLGADIKAASLLLRRSCACKIVTASSLSFPAVQTTILHVSLSHVRPSSISIRMACDEHCPKTFSKSLTSTNVPTPGVAPPRWRSRATVCRITAPLRRELWPLPTVAAPALHETFSSPLSLFWSHLASLHGC